jgi:hypothetical protein
MDAGVKVHDDATANLEISDQAIAEDRDGPG